VTPEQTEALKKASRLCVEIGLQTYGRRGEQMTQTTVDWKLQKAEALVREIHTLIRKVVE
jgi:hypothetical protein